MEIYQLRHFVAVAETGSFTQAAHRTHVTQPALSGSIARLESSLGARLLIRGKRSATLTPAGQLLYNQSLEILRACNQVRAEIQGGELPRALRLGILRTFPTHKLTRLIQSMQDELANFEVEIAEGTSAELDERLSLNKLDVALTILGSRTQEEDMNEMPLLTERYLLYVPEKHRLAANDEVDLSDLTGESFIVRTSCETFAVTTNILKDKKVRTRVVCRTQQDDRALELVRAGIGVALMPELYEAPGVRRLVIRDYSMERVVGLKWTSAAPMDLLEQFCTFATTHPWKTA